MIICQLDVWCWIILHFCTKLISVFDLIVLEIGGLSCHDKDEKVTALTLGALSDPAFMICHYDDEISMHYCMPFTWIIFCNYELY